VGPWHVGGMLGAMAITAVVACGGKLSEVEGSSTGPEAGPATEAPASTAPASTASASTASASVPTGELPPPPSLPPPPPSVPPDVFPDEGGADDPGDPPPGDQKRAPPPDMGDAPFILDTPETGTPEAGCAIPGCLRALAVGGGNAQSCALLSDANVYCWGDDSVGQLGSGAAGGPKPGRVPGLAGVTALATAGDHSCAILADERVWCWGSFGDIEDQPAGLPDTMLPVVVQGADAATAIATGNAIGCAVLADGTARCWGFANGSLLGDGSMDSSAASVAVTGVTDAIGIAVGTTQACVLRPGGTVRCWGSNDDGQIGDGTTVTRTTPVDVPGLTGVASIAAGEYHTCALLADGTVKCWGRNDSGQLGLGTSDGPEACFRACSTTPQVVPDLSGVVALAAGNDITCAVLSSGGVKCWGRNPWGQLGIGKYGPETTCASLDLCAPSPTSLPTLRDATGVMAGDHSCAILSDGSIQCWGDDQWGELGYVVDPGSTAECTGAVCSESPGPVQW
jgi:alpha-tubulin suppressor-like RCC1 family protein